MKIWKYLEYDKKNYHVRHFISVKLHKWLLLSIISVYDAKIGKRNKAGLHNNLRH